MLNSLFTKSLYFLVLVGVAIPPDWTESCCCRTECTEERNESACDENREAVSDCHLPKQKSSCCHQQKRPSLATESTSPANSVEISRGPCKCEKNQQWYWVPSVENANPSTSSAPIKHKHSDEPDYAIVRKSNHLHMDGFRRGNSSAQIALCIWQL